jgi:uncharacterized protein (DUF2235 family)
VALYAFDGTWNSDKDGTEDDTNVCWFSEAYDGDALYQKGVGTRAGKLGRVLGGITGAGGRTRCSNAMTALRENLKAGDTAIDIVGFSRGAALALHFANAISEKPLPGFPAGKPPAIRFVGLWDCVPSFGVPTNKLNVGWDLRLPDNVVKCHHALALDERRQTFALHRPEARVVSADQEGRLFEVWFRGVHSDVGGGNRNGGLASLALHWMLVSAAQGGVPLKDDVVQENRARINPDAPISEKQRYDLIPNRFRVVRWNDTVHASVSHRADGNGREHNNPPKGLAVADDDGAFVGQFGLP